MAIDPTDASTIPVGGIVTDGYENALGRHLPMWGDRTDPELFTPWSYVEYLDWNFIQEERLGGPPGIGPSVQQGHLDDFGTWRSYLVSTNVQIYVLIVYTVYDDYPVQYVEAVCGW